MRLALAQINTVVGDLDGNRDLILARLDEARDGRRGSRPLPRARRHRLPARRPAAATGVRPRRGRSLEQIAAQAHDVVAIVGFPYFDTDLYNACAVCADGEVKAVYRKRFLPNYGVFDEDRYFAPGRDLVLLELGGTLVGLTICEDMWQPGPPATDLALAGAELLVNISASPFHVGKEIEREEMLVTRARDNSCFVAFCNAVGGQDELIFDGHSCVLDDEGEVVARAGGFEEALLFVDVEPKAVIARRLRDVRRRALARERETTPPVQVVRVGGERATANGARIEPVLVPFEPELEQMRLALELGLHDYVRQERLPRCRDRRLRRHRLGGDRRARRRGARQRSRSLRVDAVPLFVRGNADRCAAPRREPRQRLPRDLRSSRWSTRTCDALREQFAGREADLTEENLQARIRGTLLMALSNKFGWLVVATGNKSELSVGYSTLYGDLAGGFALIKDVFKTDVFRLARHLNERAGRELIPQSIIERAPSAELRPDQRDEDSLPPYRELDRVLEAYVELDRSREELSNDGFDPELVERAVALIDRAEYKRRQAPLGVRLRPKAFGRDRRTPITNRWRG